MITILATIIILGTLILVHELGHFVAAKLCGVRVEKFSLGFPPTLLSKKFGETEYGIGAIPFGGYIRMTGDGSNGEVGEPQIGDLHSKSRCARAFIVSAGSLMNLLLAVVIFWVIIAFHGLGEVSKSAVIGGVVMDSPADSAGLVTGDSIIAINNETIAGWDEMASMVHPRTGLNTEFRVARDDSIFIIAITPGGHVVAAADGEKEIGLIGIQPSVFYKPAGVLKAVPGAFALFGEIFLSIGDFIEKIIDSGIQRGDIGGPVLIAKMAGVSARAGWAAFLFFMAALSINLGILNMLPFPVLDGGHLVYLGIEAIRRKPLSLKAKLVAQQIGVLILLALMFYVTVNDIFFVLGG